MADHAMMIKRHPTLGILVRSDGLVHVPARYRTHGHWTYGSYGAGGYMYVMINYKNYRVHRLVAETFIPNPDNKPTVDHIDRNKTNNSIRNLRWATTQEQRDNSVHMYQQNFDKKAYAEVYRNRHRDYFRQKSRAYYVNNKDYFHKKYEERKARIKKEKEDADQA